MNSPRIITAAERATRRQQGARPHSVGWYKKNPDGTRCKPCHPIVTTVRTVPPSTES